jgi:hypothetical protein
MERTSILHMTLAVQLGRDFADAADEGGLFVEASARHHLAWDPALAMRQRP